MEIDRAKKEFKKLLANALSEANYEMDKEEKLNQGLEEMANEINKETDKYLSVAVGKNKMQADLSRFDKDGIKKVAEKILEKDYVSKKENAKNLLENTLAKQNEKIEKSEQEFNVDLNKVKSKAEKSNSELKNKALKNNVARSSGVMLTQKSIEDSRQKAEDDLTDKLNAQLERANTISENAKETYDRVSKDIESEHETLLEESINKLYDIKNGNSEYDKQQVNKELALAYSNNVVDIIGTFLMSLDDKNLAKSLLETNEFIKKSTTEKERTALLGMLS